MKIEFLITVKWTDHIFDKYLMSIYNINKSLFLLSWIFTSDNQSRQTLLQSFVLFGWIISSSEAIDTTFSVSENEPIGTRVGILTEVIETFRYKAGVHFHLQQIEYQSEIPLFSINKYSGVISTSIILDRETICPKASGTNLPCSISLVVSVVEFLINVRINIIDVNDNFPTFRNPVSVVKISENEKINHTIDLERATDLDSAQFGIDSYKSDPSIDSPFLLIFSQHLLQLKLVDHLDYENISRYDLTLKVCDTASLCTEQKLVVEVIDVNDIVPQFQQNNYSVVVKETIKLGSKILRVHAFDKEKGEFGRIFYRLVDSNQHGVVFLKIDSTTGDIFVIKSLIGLTKIVCTVEAQDSGSAPKFTWTKLEIHIIDVNNNKPYIRINTSPDVVSRYLTETSYQIDLFENVKAGAILAFIKVNDKDKGPNGQVSCSFRTRDTLKRVELEILETGSKNARHKFYKLITKISYDRENKVHALEYVLNCTDGGVPSLSSIVHLNLNIVDCNEYPPYFDNQFYQASIQEESISDRIVKFSISDADATSLNTFFLNGTGSNLFHVLKIDDFSGRLVSTFPIDRERTERVDLSILVVNIGVDGKNFTSSSSIAIKIVDINDNPPMIVGRSNFEAVENSPRKTVLGKVNIRDVDEGQNAQFSVILVTTNCKTKDEKEVAGDFQINGAGEIRSSLILDYEKVQICFLKVLIADKGMPSLTSTTTITLHILDENDNSPQWIFPSNNDNQINVTISSTTPGSKLTRIRAVDSDKLGLENVTYKLHNHLGNFDLDITSGELMSISDLKPGKYSLQISAHDQGLPSRSNYSNLTMFVTMASGHTSSMSSHILFILGLIPACALVVLICAVIPIIFIVKWQKRRRHQHLMTSVQTTLYQCPDINHLVRTDLSMDVELQKKTLLTLENKNSESKLMLPMPPDLQNVCDNKTVADKTTEYSSIIKTPVNTVCTVRDSDVCSADSGQGASVEDVAGNYFKGHYDPSKYQYTIPGYHWCPMLPEDQLIECNCSPATLSNNPNHKTVNSLDEYDFNKVSSSSKGVHLKDSCWCQNCTRYTDISNDCTLLSSVNPVCQLHSNIYPIFLANSHNNNPSSLNKTFDSFASSDMEHSSTVFNTQV